MTFMIGIVGLTCKLQKEKNKERNTGGGGIEEMLVKRYKVSFRQEESVQEIYYTT